MQKRILIILLSFLILGITLNAPILLADDNDDNGNDNSGSGSNGDEDRDERRDRIREETKREFRTADGRLVKIERKVEIEGGKIKIRIKRKIIDIDGNEIEIKIKIEERLKEGVLKRFIRIEKEVEGEGINGTEFETELEIEDEFEGNESDLVAVLSNGERKLIKVLPDRAIEIALARLGTSNFTNIELKEIRHKNVLKAIYNVETNKSGRFLGLFKLKLKVKGQIDSETGEFIRIDKPWWAFLVSGENSDQSDEKVTLCHIPPGNPSAAHTITVGSPAVRAHLAHGDTLGACGIDIKDNETDTNETEMGDTETPKWFDNSSNSTVIGANVLHSIRWTDDTALDGFIFSFANGTANSFVNDTWVTFSGTSNHSNVTKFINNTVGSLIQWRVYANDTSGNLNVTDIFNYTTT